MTFYQDPIRLHDPVGNNAIAYAERMALGSQGKLAIPQWITGTLDDLALGEDIVFEEVENGKLISCKGLKSLLKIEHNGKTIYITDNHNHALYFRYEALNDGLIQPGATLLHIDQHADFNEPTSYMQIPSLGTSAEFHPPLIKGEAPLRGERDYGELSAIAHYVNTQTQIASFIKPALHSGLIKECIQIRSEAKLEETIKNYIEHGELSIENCVVDIDIDFFAHETNVTHKMILLRQLLSSAAVVTIATSPYFIDQQRAIELVRELLEKNEK